MAHIRIISPSGAIDPMYVEGASRRLLSWGHCVSVSAHALGRWGRFSGTDEERLADLIEALTMPGIDFILCARGGYGLQRIIGRIDAALPADYDYRRMPVIIGFSDITALHRWANLHGAPSLHAPMCKHLATMDEQSLPMRMMRAVLAGQELDNPVDIPTRSVVGGNLSVLCGLQATPYGLSDLEGRTLLLEDIAERHYHLERMMLCLQMSGVFDRLGGLILGHFTDCDADPGMGEEVLDTLLRIVGTRAYPIIVRAPYGHEDANCPIWLGR